MCVRLRRLSLGLLLMVLPPGLWNCSSAQQEDDQLEISDEGNWDEDENFANENGENFENGEEGFENNYGNENFANNFESEGEFAGDENSDNAGFDNMDDGGYGENFDNEDFAQSNEGIQEIIADLNEGQANFAEDDAGANLVESAPMVEEMQPSFDEAPTATTAAMDPSAVGAAGPALPEFGSKMPYIVQSGDTLAKISTKVYGQAERWADIAELSALPNPSKIFPGDVIYYQLTDETLAFATQYESLPRQEVVVGQGDTLTSISSRVFGSPQDWKIIWRHNDNIANPDRLNPGTVLHFPDTRAFAQNSKSSAEAATLAKANQNHVYEVKLELKTAEIRQDNSVTLMDIVSKVLQKASA